MLPCSCEMNLRWDINSSRARILSSFCSSLYLHPLVYLTHNRYPVTISQVCYKFIPLGIINPVKSKFPYSPSCLSLYLLQTRHRCWVTLPQLMKKGMHLLILLEPVSWLHEPSLTLLYLNILFSDFASVQLNGSFYCYKDVRYSQLNPEKDSADFLIVVRYSLSHWSPWNKFSLPACSWSCL